MDYDGGLWWAYACWACAAGWGVYLATVVYRGIKGDYRRKR